LQALVLKVLQLPALQTYQPILQLLFSLSIMLKILLQEQLHQHLLSIPILEAQE